MTESSENTSGSGEQLTLIDLTSERHALWEVRILGSSLEKVAKIRSLGDAPRRSSCLSLHLGRRKQKGPRERSDGCSTATAATALLWPGTGRRRSSDRLPRAGAGMSRRRRKMAALLSASALVVLDAACPPYVLGGSGERHDERARERHAAGAPGSGRRHERGRRSPFVLVPRRPH